MCRLYFQTKYIEELAEQELNKIFKELTVLQGGHGQGIIAYKDSISKVSKISKRKSKNIMKKFKSFYYNFYEDYNYSDIIENSNKKQKTEFKNIKNLQIVKTLYSFADFKFNSTDSFIFYHTRLASLGSISLTYTHPYITRKFLVMQNGHEPNLVKVAKYLLKKDIISDMQAVALLCEYDLQYTLSLLLQYSTSNWFIIDTQTMKFFIVISEHKGLFRYNIDDAVVYISNDILNHKSEEVYGLVQGKIADKEAVIMREDLKKTGWF